MKLPRQHVADGAASSPGGIYRLALAPPSQEAGPLVPGRLPTLWIIDGPTRPVGSDAVGGQRHSQAVHARGVLNAH